MNRYLIYGLTDPITQRLRYIGLTSLGLKRPSQHVLSRHLKGNTHKINWIKGLLSKNLRPNIVIIQEFDEADILKSAEIFWIKYFKEMGCDLTNYTPGGDGGGMKGKSHSKETKEKIGLANKGRVLGPCSDEIKLKISRAKTGKITRNRRFTDKEIIDEYLAGLSANKISKKFKGCIKTIMRILKKNNIKLRNLPKF